MAENRGRRSRSRETAANAGLILLALVVAASIVLVMRPVTPPASSVLPVAQLAPATETPTSDITSVVQRLQQAQAEGRPAMVSAIGSSLTQGDRVPKFTDTWTWETIKALQTATGGTVNLRLHTYPGTSLATIVGDRVITKVRADKPDLVIFEPSDPDNLGQSIGPPTAGRLVARVLHGLLVGQPPRAPLVVGFVGSPLVVSRRGDQRLADYVAADVQAFKRAGVAVCDVGPAMVKAARGNLMSILSDGTYPNVVGNLAWASVARSCLVGSSP